MLKFEDKVNIGDTIRAYDFKPRFNVPDSYIEGVVTATTSDGYKAFKVDVKNLVIHGEIEPIVEGDVTSTVPMEIWDEDYDHRILVLIKAK